jgi:hypothetical protein
MTRNNRFPMPSLIPVKRFAAHAVSPIERGRRFRAVPWQASVAAGLPRLPPHAVFDVLFARAPQKARKASAGTA